MKTVEGHAKIEDLDAFLDSIAETAEEFDCTIQAFDADYVVGRDHLQTAVEHADRAFERGENVARERAVEILLYAAGRRQINRALEMGVGEGESDVVVVVHCPEGETASGHDATHEHDATREYDATSEQAAAEAVRDLLEPADTLSADRIDREAVRDFFDVTETELAATDATLADLVCERVALLDVEK